MATAVYLLDDLTGYEYRLQYCQNFHSPYRSGLEIQETLRHDFTTNLGRFLKNKLEINGETSYSIANGLFAFMSNNHRHFHTPYWVLWKFHFANRYGIVLETFEQLAVWFRTAVYVPLSPHGMNESQSAMLMRSMIPFGCRLNDNTIANCADRAIAKHADHLKATGLEYRTLLDLDLAIFAAKYEVFEMAITCHRAEYIDFGQRFNIMMKKFFTALIGRPAIYRTTFFQEKFEDKARGNIKKWISQ